METQEGLLSARAFVGVVVGCSKANDSAVKALGDETLRTIARELVTTVRGNVTIDWTCARTCAQTFASW